MRDSDACYDVDEAKMPRSAEAAKMRASFHDAACSAMRVRARPHSSRQARAT